MATPASATRSQANIDSTISRIVPTAGPTASAPATSGARNVSCRSMRSSSASTNATVKQSAIRSPRRESEDIVGDRHDPQPGAPERCDNSCLVGHHHNVGSRADPERRYLLLLQQFDAHGNALDLAEPLPALGNVWKRACECRGGGLRNAGRHAADAPLHDLSRGDI